MTALRKSLNDDLHGASVGPAAIDIRPVWSHLRSAIVAAFIDATPDPAVAALDPEDRARELASTDARALGAALAVIAATSSRGRAADPLEARLPAVFCPVHLSTLERARDGLAYLERLAALDPEDEASLIWVVRGVDKEAARDRLAARLSLLAARRRATYVELEPDDPDLVRFAGLGVQALGLRWRPEYDADAVRISRGFALRAAAAGFASFVTGLTSATGIVSAVAAGVEELQGPVVLGPSHRAWEGGRLSLADLLRNAIAEERLTGPA